MKSASGDKVGIISPTDGELLPCEYTDIKELSVRFYLAEGTDGIQVYDAEQKQFVPGLSITSEDRVDATIDLIFVGETVYKADGTEFGKATNPDVEDYSYVATGKAGEHSAYSSDGTKLFFKEENISPLSGTGDYFKIFNDEGCGILDKKGEELISPQYENISTNSVGGGTLNSGCLCAQKNELWGMIDLNGNVIHDFTASSVTEYLGEGVFRVKVEGDLDTYWTANGGSYTIKPSADGNSATIVSDDGTKTTVTARSYNTYCTQDGDGLKYFNWNTGEMDIHATDNKYSRYDLDTSLTRQEGDLLAVPAESGEYKIYDVFGGEVIWNGPAYEVKGNNRFVYICDGNTEVYTVYRIVFA